MLRRNLLGRTTQRVNSPAKTAAAAMAGSIVGILPNRYGASIGGGCYGAVAGMLNVCYRRKSRAVVLSAPPGGMMGCPPKTRNARGRG